MLRSPEQREAAGQRAATASRIATDLPERLAARLVALMG
jgi:hypothetical protein